MSDSEDEKERLPKLLAIVTGKGPQKEFYMNEVMRREREEDWRWVRCRSLWLDAEDYPILLGLFLAVASYTSKRLMTLR